MFVRILFLEKGKRNRPFLPKTCLKLQIVGTIENDDGMKETNGEVEVVPLPGDF